MAWSEIASFLIAIEFLALGGVSLIGAILLCRKQSLRRSLLLGLAGIAGLSLGFGSASSYEYFVDQRAGVTTERGPTSAEMAAARAMSPEARQQMIEGMVSRLAARMRNNPKDFQGWLRLGRAYSVLGRREDAVNAYTLAKQYFPEESVRLDRLIRGLKQ